MAYLVGHRLPVPVEELMERLPAYARDPPVAPFGPEPSRSPSLPPHRKKMVDPLSKSISY